jgi:hypothetical protein
LASYNFHMVKALLLSAIAVATCGVASSSSLYVSTSGVFSSSDTADALVSPNKQFTLQFVVDSNPTPLNGTVTSLGFDVPIIGFSYSLNGILIAATPSEIRFSTLANGGLFDVIFGSGLNAAEFSFAGGQMFSGSTSTPVLSVNTYSISSWTYSDPLNYDIQTPASLSVAVTATPEPSCLLLFLCGGFALLTVSLQQFIRVR